MSLPRTATEPRREKPELPFVGFTERGSLFRSAMPVDNAITGFMRSAVHQLRDKFMAPADACMLIDTQPEWIRNAFPSREQWRGWTRAWQWFASVTVNSAEETLKRAAQPGVVHDPNAYGHFLEEAERFHGYECRFAHVGPVRFAGADFTPSPSLRLVCRVHGPFFPGQADTSDLPHSPATPTVPRGGTGV